MERVVRIATVSIDPEAESAVATLLERSSGADLSMRCTDRVGVLAAIRADPIDALVVVGAPQWFDRDVADEARSIGVSLVGITGDPFEAEVLLELGCVLMSPEADIDQLLRAAMSPSTPRPAPDKPPGRLIAVWGTKGSPGATTVAIELAFTLSRSSSGVGLVDADTYGADCLQLLGVGEDIPSLVWACRAAHRVPGDPAFIREFRRIGAEGPVLIPGLSQTSSWTEISIPAFESLLLALRATFADSVIDVGSCIESDPLAWRSGRTAGRNDLARFALDEADRVIAVADASPVGIRRLCDAWPELVSVVDPDRVLLAFNRSDHRDRSELNDIIRERLDIRPAVFIPAEPHLRSVQRLGRSLAESRSRSPVMAEVETLAARLGAHARPRGVLARLGGRR